MPDVVVEEHTCGACGAEVRADTQFCYNCGGSLGLDKADQADESDKQPDEAVQDIVQPIQMPMEPLDGTAEAIASTNGEVAAAVTVTGEPKLRSAASLRRKAKAMERKPMEIVWEPAENGTNVRFVAATVIFLIFTAFVVALALYFR